ncbi:hypothetical protein [Nocardioides ferulae]|uniref:hypothetical protein n=1 Tax=Nocardioides ferulae TaxID=2340821 RepID=UPI000EB545A8|nr:hypothetical protein [Nocardioides ferulae]
MTHSSRGPTDLGDRPLRLVPDLPPDGAVVPAPRRPAPGEVGAGDPVAEPGEKHQTRAAPRRVPVRLTVQVLGLLLGPLALAAAAFVLLTPAPQPTGPSTATNSAARPPASTSGQAVSRPADLSVQRNVEIIAATADQVALRLFVANDGPAAANRVELVTTLPVGARLVESPGSACRTVGAAVHCGLGRVGAGRSAAALVVVAGTGSDDTPRLLRWATSGAVLTSGRTTG